MKGFIEINGINLSKHHIECFEVFGEKTMIYLSSGARFIVSRKTGEVKEMMEEET